MNSIVTARRHADRLVDIAAGKPFAVHLSVGSTVHCIVGRIWLTQEGLFDDIVIGPGEKFVVRQKGLIVLNGIDGSALAYFSMDARARAGGAIALTSEFRDAARAHAAELRRQELARLACIAWNFVARLAGRMQAWWRNGVPAPTRQYGVRRRDQPLDSFASSARLRSTPQR